MLSGSTKFGDTLHFEREKFCAIVDAVERREVATLVLAHKDRLTRFGYAWFARSCPNHGCELLVLNNEKLSPERKMVGDLMRDRPLLLAPAVRFVQL